MALYNGHQEDSSGNILLSIGNGMTATLETGSTASQAYTKGSYIFFNNRLCKATAAISSGNTLSIGTNLTQTSIGEELTSHLRASNGDEFYFDYKDGKAGYYPTVSKTASEFVPFGGTPVETPLWTNRNPTSSFAAQTVTLSDSITNYKLLKFYVRSSTTNSIIQSALCTIDQIILYRQNSETACFGVTTMPNPGVTAGATRTRQYGSPSDTTMYIFDTYKITAGTGGKENSSLIPTEICGVNY